MSIPISMRFYRENGNPEFPMQTVNVKTTQRTLKFNINTYTCSTKYLFCAAETENRSNMHF